MMQNGLQWLYCQTGFYFYMTNKTTILLIDDSEQSRHDIQTLLSFLGESTISASTTNWYENVQPVIEKPSDVYVALVGNCDFLSLAELLAELHQWEAGIPFVLLADQEAPDFLDSELLTRITAKLPLSLSYQPLLDALHKAKVFHDNFNRLRDFNGVSCFNMFRSLVGNSEPIQRVRHMMGQVANTEVSVLITGESGTGKEVVARNLHLNSSRSDKSFVPINCGAIPRELLESELFGHEKGAFTGAIASHAGRFEIANGGTLFLDEIGDMPLAMQVKLLRVIQERSFERVGGVKTIKTDVRILAATHKNLEQMIESGDFRQDLYYRINVFPIEMPSLRERAEDVPLLLNELITILEAEKRGSVRFNSGAMISLCRHPWPGNVRELANLVERMAILYPHGIVGINDLPKKFRHLSDQEISKGDREVASSNGVIQLDQSKSSALTGALAQDSLLPLNGLDLKEYLANLEKDLIEQALTDSGGVVARAADRLYIRRTTLVEKMRKYSLSKKQSQDTEELESEPADENVESATDIESGKAASA
jgi:sigma-54 specific flagellar transcriptional regulator A